MLQDADQESGHDIDDGDEDAGDGVALGEAGGAVHGAVELGFARDLFSAGARLTFVDQARVQIGIDRHLLAGHGVQGEPRGDFRDAHRAVVDDHVLNRDQHQEDHHADHVVAADHEIPERLDHLACRGSSRISVQQNGARGGDVQRQAEQRQQQQGGGEHAELDGPLDVQRDQQDHHRQHDVGRDQHVQQERRNRRDHDEHDHQHGDGHAEILQSGQTGGRDGGFN